MLRNIETFINDLLGDDPPQSIDEEETQVACAALLVHCARADGHQSVEEERSMREILTKRFQLSSEETEELIKIASQQEKDAVDLHRFTRVLHENLDREGRLEIIRLLWALTHADGKIDHDERSVVTLVAQLLHVEVHDAVALRREVLKGRGSG